MKWGAQVRADARAGKRRALLIASLTGSLNLERRGLEDLLVLR